ncbi:MAG: twin-arginine translocase TatA/TatE family subunit [Chloroflexota bacterium]|nr:twin-arginine translocase TatA/TatE family subunit [Chloroflexota bacterium]
MNLFGVGTGELLFILLIALLVLGPERLPQIARYWAKLSRSLRYYSEIWQNVNAEIERQLKLEELMEETDQRRETAAAQQPLTSDPNPQTSNGTDAIAEPVPALQELDELSANTIAPPGFGQPVESAAPQETGAASIAQQESKSSATPAAPLPDGTTPAIPVVDDDPAQPEADTKTDPVTETPSSAT